MFCTKWTPGLHRLSHVVTLLIQLSPTSVARNHMQVHSHLSVCSNPQEKLFLECKQNRRPNHSVLFQRREKRKGRLTVGFCKGSVFPSETESALHATCKPRHLNQHLNSSGMQSLLYPSLVVRRVHRRVELAFYASLASNHNGKRDSHRNTSLFAHLRSNMILDQHPHAFPSGMG